MANILRRFLPGSGVFFYARAKCKQNFNISLLSYIIDEIMGGSAMFKILVVEDDRDLNRTVCAFLNASGYMAIGCLNAEAAYDAMYANMFDLIV